MSYERDMSIDPLALDVEWVEQAELAMKYGRLWADAQDACTRAEEKIKLVRSQLIIEITKNPEKFGLIKTTDPMVEAAYRADQRHIDAKEDWLEKLNAVNLLSVAKNEISFTRKSALENLVTLHGQNYFAGPSVPRNLKEKMEQRKETRNSAKESANRRIRVPERNKS